MTTRRISGVSAAWRICFHLRSLLVTRTLAPESFRMKAEKVGVSMACNGTGTSVSRRGGVEEDRFGAVWQEHRHAVAANELGARREGILAPPHADLIVDVLEGEILPGLGRIVVDLVGNVVGPDGQVMRRGSGASKDVKRLDAFKAVVRKVLGNWSSLLIVLVRIGGASSAQIPPGGCSGGRRPAASDYVLSVSADRKRAAGANNKW